MPPKPAAAGKNVKAGAGKGKKGKKKKEPEPEPEPQLQDSEASVVEKEFDLVTDLNDEFFIRANKVNEFQSFQKAFNITHLV